MDAEQTRNLATIEAEISKTVPAEERPVALAVLSLAGHMIELGERLVAAAEKIASKP